MSLADEMDYWLAELANPDAPERVTAAFTLGGAAKKLRPRAIRALRLAVADIDTEVADFAAASLAQLRDVESLPAIERLLQTGRPRDRSGSVWAMGELGALTDEAGRRDAMVALRAFRRRTRGRSRVHADLVIQDLQARLGDTGAR